MEIVSIDDDWRKNTTDAVAAQLRDAGFNIKRTIIPGSTFWNDWTKYPFSSTNWNHRPLDTQILGLAYRSGEAWNESGFANAEFDALLAQANAIADAEARREVMAKLAPVDLAPASFTPGMFRRTRIAQVPAAFWMPQEGVFRVVCFRSVAQYVFDVLCVAAQPGSEVGAF